MEPPITPQRGMEDRLAEALARATAAEAALAEAREHERQTHEIIAQCWAALGEPDDAHEELPVVIKSLCERLAAACKTRDAQEKRAHIAEDEAMSVVADNDELRERGEALARAGEKLEEYFRYDPHHYSPSPAWKNALAAWREIAPAAPEKEKDNG